MRVRIIYGAYFLLILVISLAILPILCVYVQVCMLFGKIGFGITSPSKVSSLRCFLPVSQVRLVSEHHHSRDYIIRSFYLFNTNVGVVSIDSAWPVLGVVCLGLFLT